MSAIERALEAVVAIRAQEWDDDIASSCEHGYDPWTCARCHVEAVIASLRDDLASGDPQRVRETAEALGLTEETEGWWCESEARTDDGYWERCTRVGKHDRHEAETRPDWDYRPDIDGPQSNGQHRWVTGWVEVPDA